MAFISMITAAGS